MTLKGTKMGPFGYQNDNLQTFLIKYIVWPLIFFQFIFRRRISGQKKTNFAAFVQNGTKMGHFGYQNGNLHTFIIKYIVWPLIFFNLSLEEEFPDKKQILLHLSKMVPKWVFWAPKWHCAHFYDKIYHVTPHFFLFYL